MQDLGPATAAGALPLSVGVPCPVCGAKPVGPSRQYLASEWATLRCPECTVEFVWPLPREEELSALYDWRIYASRQYLTFPGTDRRRARMWDEILDSVTDHPAPERRSVLEVGCGYGYFMEAALRRGWHVEGIELDPATARRAGERLGVVVHVGDGRTALQPLGRFDLITASHWLEHLPDPRSAIAEVARHVNPGGLVIVRVPDSGSPVARSAGANWTWFCPPVHLFYFAERSLGALASSVGLRVVSVRHHRGDAHLWPLECAVALGRSAIGPPGVRDRPQTWTAEVARSPIKSVLGRITEAIDLVPERAVPPARWNASELVVVLTPA
ncbi:MAG: class I SAM-dependent methyltransferase [Thermoplasmata archaeon]|nr:class I SAM-dependent methyltransferase [Thermoplasmata archaeon]